MIIRQFHTVLKNRLEEEKPLIQVLLGPRQVGKTTAAKALYDEWKGPKIMASADFLAPISPPLSTYDPFIYMYRSKHF